METLDDEETNFTDGRLIQCVKSQRCIWHSRDRNFKTVLVKDAAWKRISNDMRLPVEDCVKSWKRLRQRYSREKLKVLAGIQTPGTPWEHYPALNEFLYDFVITRKRGIIKPELQAAANQQHQLQQNEVDPNEGAVIWNSTGLTPEGHVHVQDMIEVEMSAGDESDNTLTAPEVVGMNQIKAEPDLSTMTGNDMMTLSDLDHRKSAPSEVSVPDIFSVLPRQQNDDDYMEARAFSESCRAQIFTMLRNKRGRLLADKKLRILQALNSIASDEDDL